MTGKLALCSGLLPIGEGGGLLLHRLIQSRIITYAPQFISFKLNGYACFKIIPAFIFYRAPEYFTQSSEPWKNHILHFGRIAHVFCPNICLPAQYKMFLFGIKFFWHRIIAIHYL